ncbi:maleylacetoacetate isomerase [Sphingomonas gilva]|uniref:Maleylacetoacetate isomerase n=1 Tax=Sphingomonas gilva TaxID=2305907 RepID=A0A396RPE0_9SPHN|nr:maleylacetoacetate isomerase [Sphingomonas gilva]RHW18424.1 maleylacetoacetate isomerase [Sphingomonas gilva]
MSVVLHDYWRSSASYRVRIALSLKDVAYERRDVSLIDNEQRAPAHLARNPQGFVPTLEIDGHVLTQSLAIIDYLDATRPEPPLAPRDPAARAAVLAQALLIAADIHPINNLRVLRYLKNELGQEQAAIDDWYRHWMREGFVALEAMAAGAGTYLGGDAPNLADICLVPQMYNARRLELPLEAFPTLVRLDAAAAALPAFAAAHPDAVKGG